MLIAHLSDLHLREAGDVSWLERQLDRIAGRHPDHLAITGDLLDRWSLPLLDRALDALAARGLLDARLTTILHGNHDLASSGGHPGARTDLWRLARRSWDPPPLIRRRRQRFAARIDARAPGVAGGAPYVKPLDGGGRLAVVDSVAVPWLPFRVRQGRVEITQAMGTLPERQSAWLESLPAESGPLVVLMHHYPLGEPSYEWRGAAPLPVVRVRMHVPAPERERFWGAAAAAGVHLVLCGHVHRARLDWHGTIAVGLNGQSGASWAGRTIAWYELEPDRIQMSASRGD